MGNRAGCPNEATLEKVPEPLLRRLYQDLDLSDLAISEQLGVTRATVKRMREHYGIPTTSKKEGNLAWHASRTEEERSEAAAKSWRHRRERGTDKTGVVPRSAFKPGNDNGRSGRPLPDWMRQKISRSLVGRFVGAKNPMFGRSPTVKRNGHRGGYMESPAQGRVWMRSSWEIEYAGYLSRHGIDWRYEPESFDFGFGLTYRPDFYLPATDEWVEVKGYMTPDDHLKHAALKNVYGIEVKVIGKTEMVALGLRLRPSVRRAA